MRIARAGRRGRAESGAKAICDTRSSSRRHRFGAAQRRQTAATASFLSGRRAVRSAPLADAALMLAAASALAAVARALAAALLSRSPATRIHARPSLLRPPPA